MVKENSTNAWPVCRRLLGGNAEMEPWTPWRRGDIHLFILWSYARSGGWIGIAWRSQHRHRDGPYQGQAICRAARKDQQRCQEGKIIGDGDRHFLGAAGIGTQVVAPANAAVANRRSQVAGRGNGRQQHRGIRRLWQDTISRVRYCVSEQIAQFTTQGGV